MTSSVPLVPNYVYVVTRLKMAESVNSRVGTNLLCHYKETNVIFPIGGLVQSSATLTAATIRDCRHLINFRIEQNDRLGHFDLIVGFGSPSRFGPPSLKKCST